MQKFFLSFLFFIANTGYSQWPATTNYKPVNNDPKLLWIEFGVGLIGPGPGLDLKLTYSWGINSIATKGIIAAAFSPGGSGPGGTIEEIGLYYGRQNFTRSTLARIAAGISYFHGVHDYGQEIHSFGIGVEGEAMLKSVYIGTSLVFTLMFMPHFLYAGILLN